MNNKNIKGDVNKKISSRKKTIEKINYRQNTYQSKNILKI